MSRDLFGGEFVLVGRRPVIELGDGVSDYRQTLFAGFPLVVVPVKDGFVKNGVTDVTSDK